MKSLDDLRKLAQDHTRLDSALGNDLAQSFYVIVPKGVLDYCIDEIQRELEEHYVELPLDKDGVPINIGDEMVSCGRHRFRFIVSELDFTDAFVHAVGIVGDGKYFFKPSEIVHHHKPTVGDVLREFAIACEDAGNAGDAVNRLISEYAERLQLKEE